MAVAVRAFLIPSPSALKVVGFRGPPEAQFPKAKLLPLGLSRAGFEALCRHIHAAYRRDEHGRPIRLGRGRLPAGQFYKAQGWYSYPNTCNLLTVRALRAAGAIQESIRALGIGIRAGLHAGEIELREGGHRVGGIAVHIAARVAAMAAAGEILVSSTVKDLVAGSGVEFEDRGLHTLKGVPDAWRLFAVADTRREGRREP